MILADSFLDQPITIGSELGSGLLIAALAVVVWLLLPPKRGRW